MSIAKIIFLGKSKKKQGETKFMLNALRRCVQEAVFINLPRYKKYFFWTDYRKVIYNKILNFNPDLVLIYSKDIPYQVLKKINRAFRTAIFYPDSEGLSDEKLLRYGRLVDYLFITNNSQLAELQSLGIKNPIFCMQGCDPDDHRIIPTKKRKWASDVAFIGRPNKDNRINLLQAVNQRFHLKAWGGRWKDYGLTCLKIRVYPKEFGRICYATKIILGCDQYHDMEGYFSNRTWITMGFGGFLLTNYVPGLENIFTKGEHLEWYRSQEECLDLIDYYLKHEHQRKKIAQSGYEYVHKNRPWDVVIEEIISRVENDGDFQ